MTLREVLESIDFTEINLIEYRTIISIDSDDVDVLAGFCRYEDEQLISEDGDIYSLDDEIRKYMVEDGVLTVWYEGEYINGN